MEEIVIIGSGCAGMGAAIYAARAGMSPLVIEGAQPGGLLTTTSDVENFPGFPEGVNGFDLLWKMREQAQKFGARIENAVVEKVDFSGETKKVFCSGEKVFEAKKIVVATGSSPRMTGAKGEAEMYGGKGVSACATCDGAFYSVVDEILPDENGLCRGVAVRNAKTGEKSEIACKAVFVAIGHKPNTDIFKGILEMDDEGYIVPLSGTQVKTNVENVFVAGDCADKTFRQAITASAMGCMAAILASS